MGNSSMTASCGEAGQHVRDESLDTAFASRVGESVQQIGPDSVRAVRR
ncbi:hypothetical protein ACIBG0_36195 [Nocardia sp. NPDC050630]